MKKIQIQEQVLQNSKPLALSKFSWDGKTNTFSSLEDNLVLDFSCINNATVTAGSNLTVTAGHNAVIIRRGFEFCVIQPKKGDKIQTCPCDIKGYVINGLYNDEPHIIADGILFKIVSKKGDVYKVIDHSQTKKGYLIKNNKVSSHKETLKQAKEK